MNKLKLFAIIFVASFLAIAVVTVNIQINKIRAYKAEIERIQTNNMYLMSDNMKQSKLVLKQQEISGFLKFQVDSLAEALKVKPKFIDRIVYQTITEKDTVVKEVPVHVLKKDTWLIADTGKCFVWKGIATLTDTVLSVKRNDFAYQNKITFVAYRKRPGNCIFKKRINFAEISSECGNVTTQEFQFIK